MGAVVRVGIVAPFPLIEPCHQVRRRASPKLIGAANSALLETGMYPLA
jgi:hypothetical protein